VISNNQIVEKICKITISHGQGMVVWARWELNCDKPIFKYENPADTTMWVCRDSI